MCQGGAGEGCEGQPEALAGALVSLLQCGNEAETALKIICIWGNKCAPMNRIEPGTAIFLAKPGVLGEVLRRI